MRNFIPYLVVILLSGFFFLAASFYPYEIWVDALLQTKSAQQWIRQETKLLNSVSLPAQNDISQDTEAWIFLWPAGMAIFFIPLLALGFPLGPTLRVIAYLLFILGSLGWLKLSDKIKVSFSVKMILALILPMYSLTIASATMFIPDILPFAFMPWLFIYTLYLTFNLDSRTKLYPYFLFNFSLLGILLGLVYWIKYSAFLVSLGLLLFIAVYLLFLARHYPLVRRWLLLSACAFALFLPVLALILLNRHFTGTFFPEGNISHYTSPHSVMMYGKPFFIKWVYLLISLAGSGGLVLFQGWYWLRHITHYSDRLFPLFSSLGFNQRTLLISILGVPGSLAMLWLLFYSRRLFNRVIFIFTCCITLVPFALLLWINTKATSNVLTSGVQRYASAFFIFTQTVLFSSFLHFISRHKRGVTKIFILLAVIIFFVIPNAFILINFFKNAIFERIGRPYIVTDNYLFQPTLSNTNVGSVVERIRSLVKSTKDVVVLANPDSYGGISNAWLEIKQRTLPLLYFYSRFFYTHDTEAVDLRGSLPYRTSQDLRVILVISKFLESDGKTLSRLEQRFPQAQGWQRMKEAADSDSLVSIWYADLKVHNNE